MPASGKVKPLVGLLASVLVAVVFGGPADPARVRVIAEMLPEEPGFPEMRIGNRAAWERLAAEDPKQTTAKIAEAEKIAASPVPEIVVETYFAKDIDRKLKGSYTMNSKKRGMNLMTLVFAECLENKGRFFPAIVAHMEAIAAQPTWVNWYHDSGCGDIKGLYHLIDLDSSVQANYLGIELDLLKGKLPADTVRRVRTALDEKVLDCYLAVAEGRGGTTNRASWFFCDNNWNAACHHQTLGAALRVVEDRAVRAKFVEGAERGVRHFTHGFSPDGYCQEGLSYWNYGYGQFLYLAHTVRHATRGGVDFFADPQARLNFLYAFNCVMAPRCATAYGDGDAIYGASSGNLALGEIAWPDLATQFSRKQAMGRWLEDSLILGFWRRPSVERRQYVHPLRSFFEHVGMLVCRPAPDAPSPRLFATIKGGHNGVPHNHNDAGAYEIAVDEIALVQDPGHVKYDLDSFGPKRYDSPLRGSYGHDVPFVAGRAQKPGKAYGARVVRTDFTSDVDVLVLDLRGAYANATDTSIRKLERTFRFDRAAKEVVVTDEVELSESGAFEVPITTYGEVVRGATADELVISRKTADGRCASVRARVSVSGGAWTLREERLANPGKPDVRRLAIALNEPVKTATVSVRYSPISSVCD